MELVLILQGGTATTMIATSTYCDCCCGFFEKNSSDFIQLAVCPKYKKKGIFEGHWKIFIIANIRSQ